MATLLDIAKSVGVSQATVCRVLRGNNAVSSELATKVKKAAKSLGYDARVSQSGPVDRKRTGFVGLVLLGVDPQLLRLPHIAELVTALENVLAESEFQLVVHFASQAEKLPSLLNHERLDGALVVGHPPQRVRPVLTRLNCVLLLGSARRPEESLWADWVTSDYMQIGDLAARYLIAREHRRLAFVNVTPSNPALTEVWWGFTRASQEVSIDPVQFTTNSAAGETIWNPERHAQEMSNICDKLLKLPDEARPTGLLVSECGAVRTMYEAFTRYGFKVGSDIEFISRERDNIYLADLIPRPASVITDCRMLAECAVGRLLHRMRRPDEPACIRTMVQPRLAGAL